MHSGLCCSLVLNNITYSRSNRSFSAHVMQMCAQAQSFMFDDRRKARVPTWYRIHTYTSAVVARPAVKQAVHVPLEQNVRRGKWECGEWETARQQHDHRRPSCFLWCSSSRRDAARHVARLAVVIAAVRSHRYSSSTLSTCYSTRRGTRRASRRSSHVLTCCLPCRGARLCVRSGAHRGARSVARLAMVLGGRSSVARLVVVLAVVLACCSICRDARHGV